MKIHDISIVLDQNTIVFPGDAPVDIHQLKHAEKDEWNLSAISLGAHSGTHVDSLSHIENSDCNCLNIPLERCYGECVVLDMTHLTFGTQITMDDLKKYPLKGVRIVLLKTKNSSLNDAFFHEDFVCLSDSGASYLLDCKVQTVGIDYLSIGPKKTHQILLRNEVLVFENLALGHIAPGHYLFVGLPLKIGLEGAPARAILIES